VQNYSEYSKRLYTCATPYCLMSNRFGIPEKELNKIRVRATHCAYCHKMMIYPFDKNRQQDSATIEHFNFDGPFYWKKGLKIQDIIICCGECNSSRGAKRLHDWFKSKYCKERSINQETVADSVKQYLLRKEKAIQVILFLCFAQHITKDLWLC